MPLAAVPSYLGKDFSQASLGLRFNLYLSIWTKQWCKDDDAARAAWRQLARLNDGERAAMQAVNQRLDALAATLPESSRLRLEAVATAPFTTGLGNGHPLENGFAFLFPYGIPYLAGSGVKGVLRRAAQELARGDWGDDNPWFGLDQPCFLLKSRDISLSVIDVLFGREPAAGEGEHVRGALDVWDVIPLIDGKSLLVEIMTPHQNHYYQDREPPHECANPVPIHFLTVAPGARFVFRLVCHIQHLHRLTRVHPQSRALNLLATDREGKARWQELVEAAFAHAFDWLGFGAKTAVGYGAMQRDEAAEAAYRQQAQAAEEEARKRAERDGTPQRRRVQEFIDYAEKELQRPKRPKRPKSKVGQKDYQEAQRLAKDAQAPEWSPEDRAAARKAIEDYLPRLADIALKEVRKKLELDKLGEPPAST